MEAKWRNDLKAAHSWADQDLPSLGQEAILQASHSYSLDCHLPEFLRGLKRKECPIPRRCTTGKVHLTVQMADCVYDANRKWRPQHSKHTSLARLGNNLKCISTKDHRTCPCKHTGLQTGCNTTALMCALAHLRKVIAGDNERVLQHWHTLSHILLRYFESCAARVAPEMQCSLYNSPSAGPRQNLQSSHFLKIMLLNRFSQNPAPSLGLVYRVQKGNF